MKKSIKVLFVMLLLVSLFVIAGCDKKENSNNDNNNNNNNVNVDETIPSDSSVANESNYNGSILYPTNKIEINGAKSDATFIVTMPDKGTITSAEEFASSINGELVNICNTASPGVSFNTAKINFFISGIEDLDSIFVYQLQDGNWVQLNTPDIKKNHVVVNINKHGTLAFIRSLIIP